LWQHTNGSNTLGMSNIDVWSDLRWMSASNMTLWHHFPSTSNPEFPILGTTWPVEWHKGTHMPLRQHSNGSSPLYMSNKNVWSNLRRISTSTMRIWYHSHSTSDVNSTNMGSTRLLWW
jgi:hypothetical protein